MNLWHSLGGIINLEATGADIPRTLTMIQDENIPMFNVVSNDELTVSFRIQRRYFHKVKKIIHKRGDVLRIIGREGIFWRALQLSKRWVLLSGFMLIFALSMFLPTRIYFIQIEGNHQISERQILEQAELCGIKFGASRKEVRSEKMKNALLEAMPQLKWAGINTVGCTAVISVREREMLEQQENASGVTSMVASRDGIVLSCTVTRGNPLCKTGQAVKKGQTLISGYTDCGLSIRAASAQGEIIARTEHVLDVISAANYRSRTDIIRIEKKYSLIIGKKQINFYKDSGISDTSCDKMYYKDKLTLPGGFVLPVSLITEVWTYYDTIEAVGDAEQIRLQMSEFAADYLGQHMIAGEILSADETFDFTDEIFSIQGRYACKEMICRVQKEEVITPDGEYD